MANQAHAPSPATSYEFPHRTTPQAAEILGVSEATLYRLLRTGRAPASYLVGSRRQWRECDRIAWLEGECRQAGKAGA